MSASTPQESGEVRIGHSLNKEEEEFVAKRRKDIQQSLKKLKIHCSENEVPNIALLGSGGGQRAMVGLLGSLVQLQKTGLLDCILYLSGVSGSTWCMASLYQEPDWSTKLETVKDKIVQRLNGPGVNWAKSFHKMWNFYQKKDFFSFTDFWAAMVITDYVKEIDEDTLTDHWDQQSNDPFPIYTVIDKQCKQDEDADPWFEFTPYEAGYSLIGAFVETSSFGSKFEKGCKIKKQPEMDMLYLQALCGSAVAEGEENREIIWKQIQDSFKNVIGLPKTEKGKGDLGSTFLDGYFYLLKDFVEIELSVLSNKDPSDLDEYISTKLNELTGGLLENDLLHILKSIVKCIVQWIWGRKYNFLYKMKDEAVPSTLRKSETRDYIDAGLLLNSPYFSVLREERKVDLIISLDFSEDDPFMAVKKAVKMCKKRKINFPKVKIPDEDVKKPKDFYVFKGQNAPTVIHIPLLNEVNCGDKIEDMRNRYRTVQGPYSPKMITELMEVAGKNITNNRAKLLDQIRAAIKGSGTVSWLKFGYTPYDSLWFMTWPLIVALISSVILILAFR
ncbi:cytosolic phospholipase A2 gamma-like isoform X2 [Pseudorasbora parva]|uniref:cytosolic phospholipase A2 gamma-like isoform X2 n=1 Tax=Pseudorasbora parva TaxID=51549 RepID=UPI00351E1CA8